MKRLNIMWCRAVDFPSSKPPFFKYTSAKTPRKYEKFSDSDSALLEAAYTNKIPSQIVLNDGLFTVDFSKRIIRPTYWDGPQYKVIRGTWFKTPSMQPLEEDMASKIEKLWDKSRENLDDDIARSTATFEGRNVLFSVINDVVTASIDVSLLDSIRSLGEKVVYVRGYHVPKKVMSAPKNSKPEVSSTSAANSGAATSWSNIFGSSDQSAESSKATSSASSSGTSVASAAGVSVSAASSASATSSASSTDATSSSTSPGEESPTQEPPRPRPIKHLIFCVHGIGQKLSVRFDFVSFVKDSGLFREGLQKEFLQSKDAQAAAGDDKNNGIQVLPVLWRQSWDFISENSDPVLKGLTPESVFYRDNVLADVALDFVMYTNQKIREKVQKITVDLINTEYKRFCENHPEFAENPKVSIVGHSLGSVIANDIFHYDENPFPFETEKLFFLGSPVAVLDLFNGIAFTKPKYAKNVYNIMRPSDPVASRLEPLVLGESAKQIVPKQLSRKEDSIIDQIVDSINTAVSYTNKLANNVNSVWQTVNTALINDKTKPQEELKPVSDNTQEKLMKDLAQFNRYSRLDFSIPEPFDISLAIGLAGHMTYFESPEVAAFVLKEIYNLGEEKKARVLEKEEVDDSEPSK